MSKNVKFNSVFDLYPRKAKEEAFHGLNLYTQLIKGWLFAISLPVLVRLFANMTNFKNC